MCFKMTHSTYKTNYDYPDGNILYGLDNRETDWNLILFLNIQ